MPAAITAQDQKLREETRTCSAPVHVSSGHYRLGGFPGAVLNPQLEQREEQARMRERHGRYLAAELSRLPESNVRLGPPTDMDDIAHAFPKVHRQGGALKRL